MCFFSPNIASQENQRTENSQKWMRAVIENCSELSGVRKGRSALYDAEIQVSKKKRQKEVGDEVVTKLQKERERERERSRSSEITTDQTGLSYTWGNNPTDLWCQS